MNMDLQRNIMMFIMTALQASVRDNASVDLDNMVEKRIPRMGIYENLTADELWNIVGEASSNIKYMEETGTSQGMVEAINTIKEWGYEKTALALIADVMLVDEKLGDLERKVFGGLAGHLGVNSDIQLSILLGVRAFSRPC